MASAGLKILGAGALIKGLKEASDKILPNKLERVLHRALTAAGKESDKEVPVDTGHLKANKLPPKTFTKNKNQVEVRSGYGKYVSTPGYFLYVHERLDLHHDGQTKAKFLEDPVKRAVKKETENIDLELL